MRDAAALGTENTETEGAGPGLRVPFSATSNGLAPASRNRLTKIVVSKLILDLLFVAGLAVYSHTVAFNPFFTGSLDHADARSVRGWVVDRARPDEPVEVQLYIDERFVAAGFASEPRPDVSAKGFAVDERHGFVFLLNPEQNGEHVARVYAVHSSRGGARRTLQQIGKSLSFK